MSRFLFPQEITLHSQSNRDWELSVRGMTCAACVRRIEKALKKLPAIAEVRVNLATERVIVRCFPEESATASELKGLIERAGYEMVDVAPYEDRRAAEARHRQQERNALTKSLIVAFLFSTPLFLLSMLPMLIPSLMDVMMLFLPMSWWNGIMAALASVVQFGPGIRFYRLGWKSFRQGSPDMNGLVMLGTTAAFGYSLFVTLLPNLVPVEGRHVYFESSAVVITLVLLGKCLEMLARGKASDSISFLMRLKPSIARKVKGPFSEVVPVDTLRVKDWVEVLPGDVIPVDGVVLTGSSYVDESRITGESNPTFKESGSRVVGGTINGNGTFQMEVQAIGEDTMLARIAAFVEIAQSSKLPIQSVADRVVAVFTPIVVFLAILTAMVWMSFGGNRFDLAVMNAVAVLIIACPCAMGLATPISILVGSGKGAAMGVLFRNGGAIEALSKVDKIAIDKTGTLTQGHPQVTDFAVAPQINKENLLQIAASVELKSEHPMGMAIVDWTKKQITEFLPLPVNQFEAIRGRGVSAFVTFEGTPIRVEIGSRDWMSARSIPATMFQPEEACFAEEEKSVLFVAFDGSIVAIFGVMDPIQEGAREMISAIKKMDIEVAMITGDQAPAARRVGRELSIDEVYSQVLPEEKSTIVHQMQESQRRVAFVGDGINDAPALAQADVGIAIGSGTDIAKETADILLISNDLRALVNAIALARAILRNIRINLFWAFSYNAILIPIAAGVLYPFNGWLLSPMIAALAMSISSLFVVTNALSLRRRSLGRSH